MKNNNINNLPVNVLTNEALLETIDLQLFGGDGKSGGKFLGAVLVGVLCAGFGAFGVAGGGWFAGSTLAQGMGSFMLGASLFSCVWSATHKQELDTSDSTANVQRFDKAQETMTSVGVIPIVYGQRKICGNQTFHETNAEQTTLHKHVVLCEGDIGGIDSISANGLIIPTGSQIHGTVFTLQNTKYTDATVSLSDKTITLSSSGGAHSIYLCNKEDFEDNYDEENTFWSYQTNVSSLISYINMLGEGWQAFPIAGTYKYPGDLSITRNGNVYNNPNNLTASVVTGGTNYTFHDCSTPSNYSVVGSYSHMAWLDMTFTSSSELNGNPSVECIVRGKKVYDIRTGTTAYSTNPAMCLRDFILSKRYGLGRWFSANDLDSVSWTESANYCDEIITFKTADGALTSAKRYELNMIIDSKRSAMDWLQEILANFGGYLVFSDGKLKLRIEKQTPVSYRFDDSNCKDIKISPLSLSETPNRYEISIVDPLNNWSTIKALCEDFADQKTRQKIVTKTVSLEGVTSQNQALRLARFYRDYNLVCPLQISFSTGMQAMHLECGDVVTVSYHNVFSNLPIRINEITETNKGEFEISGRQYNDSIYGDELGGGIQYYNYTVVQDNEGTITPSTPINLTAKSYYKEYTDGTTDYEIKVSFTMTTGCESVKVYYKTKAMSVEEIEVFEGNIPADEIGFSKAWISAGDGTSNIVIKGCRAGETYRIRAVGVSSTGTFSEYTNYIDVVVEPKRTVPLTPTNFSYDFTNSFYFTWKYNGNSSDVSYYELRTNSDVGSENGLLGRTSNTSIELANLTLRVGVIYLFAVNQQRVASLATYVKYIKAPPIAPVITSSSTIVGTLLMVTNRPTDVQKVKFYIEGNNYSDVAIQEGSSYHLNAPADVYKIKASYIDVFGEGTISDESYTTITPTFDGTYIEDGTISMAKVNSVVQQALNDGTTANNAIVQIVQSASADSQQAGYSAITQLNDAINFRVSQAEMDGEDIISQINLSPQGTTIDGKYLHVTGTTLFDSNVISNGMIAANTITGDKISSNTITANNMNISSLSALCATIGTLRTKTSGARVEIKDNLICVYDDNNVCRVKMGVF